MQQFDIQEMIGPSVLMPGGEIDLEEAIRISSERFPDQAFCVTDEWVWLDLDAPDLVNEELAREGKRPVMLLVFNVLFDSSVPVKTQWFRSTPLVDFSDGMFFHTSNKIYVLLGQGRRKSMSLSAVIRFF